MQFRSEVSSRVLGTEVPNFRRFSFLSSQVLRLYRAYWRVLQQLPPEDQLDAKFKLRNEFRRPLGPAGAKGLSKQITKGYGQLEHWKGVVDAKKHRFNNNNNNANTIDFSDPAEVVWERVKGTLHNTVPGLAMENSVPLRKSLKERRRRTVPMAIPSAVKGN
eukprot:PhM_4_TR15819/c0_g1_i1/m.87972